MQTSSSLQLTLDLNAVRENFRIIKSQITPHVEVSAAVKADAYGLGALQIAPVLYDEGCRNFFVAHLDEARILRENLTFAEPVQIFVLNGLLPEQISQVRELNVIPVANSLTEVQMLQDYAKAQKEKMPIAVHFDTGMNRLGFNFKEAFQFIEKIGNFEFLDFVLWLSHFVRAEEQGHEMNHVQLCRFKALLEKLPKRVTSLANTSGVFLGSDCHFDMVRPGYGLYGGNPIAGAENPMKPVLYVEAPLMQIKAIEPGETIGYNGTYVAKTQMRLGVVSYGYGDGLFRSLSNHGFLVIAGNKAPIVGRVSMDLTVVDLTHPNFDSVKRGDMVEVLGRHQTIDDLAAQAGTNGYEILTHLGHRFQKRYVDKKT